MNKLVHFSLNGDVKRIRICAEDRGIAGDTIYTLILNSDSEPRVEMEIDHNQSFKSAAVTTIPKQEWDSIILDGKALSEHVSEILSRK